jgi:hypothetical protein
VSYVYPDGLGWPYANNYTAPGFVRSAFVNFRGQEEIHGNGIVMVGALWDAYERLLNGNVDVSRERFRQMQKLITKTLELSPKPGPGAFTPVGFVSFADQLISTAAILGWNGGDVEVLRTVFKERGLYEFVPIESGWAFKGNGVEKTPGILIEDNPLQLKAWARQHRGDESEIDDSLSIDGKLDPGEIGVVWFDIANDSDITAGGIEIKVTSLDPDIEILDSRFNLGAVNESQASIFYSKINGVNVVKALDSLNPAYVVPNSNTYFGTNPYFDQNAVTGLWVRVKPEAAKKKTVTLRLSAQPSNGLVSEIDFAVEISP